MKTNQGAATRPTRHRAARKSSTWCWRSSVVDVIQCCAFVFIAAGCGSRTGLLQLEEAPLTGNDTGGVGGARGSGANSAVGGSLPSIGGTGSSTGGTGSSIGGAGANGLAGATGLAGGDAPGGFGGTSGSAGTGAVGGASPDGGGTGPSGAAGAGGSAGIDAGGAAGSGAGAAGAPCAPGTPSCSTAVCGDAIIESPEQCDDGNRVNGDGCSASCTSEPKAISVGGGQACALSFDGILKCWGIGGSLGLGDYISRGDLPNQMGDNLPAVDLGTGRTASLVTAGEASCALLDNGTVKCWGLNNSGQLGLGDTTDRGDQPGEMGDNLPAVDLGTGRTAMTIIAGPSGAMCAVLDNGTLKCWGWNLYGQLGLGDTTNRGDQPGEMGDNLPAVDLGTGRTARAVSVGYRSACALLDDGTVKCWGENDLGELGLGDTTNRGDQPGQMGDNLPVVDLGTGRTARAITVGDYHACALLDDGTVKCWGWNSDDGTLGLGDTINHGDQPGEMGDSLPTVDLGTGRTARALSAGVYQTCALLDNGTVKCWGYSTYHGALGLGDTDDRGDLPGQMGDNLPAVDLGTGRTARAVATRGYSACALLDDGTVKCWGANDVGELGLGDTVDRGDLPGQMGDNLPAVDLTF